MDTNTEKSRRRRTFIYLWVLIALTILLVAATYTWFSLSQTPHVNDLAIYVNTNSGIELAYKYDAPDGDWGQTLEFNKLVSDDYPLKPATWSDLRQCFVAVRYGFDGRSTGDIIELNDRQNANRDDAEGYYVVGVFYARSDTPCKVSLAEAAELNEGKDGAGTYVIGTPVWDAARLMHIDGGLGAENAIRFGFRVTPIDPETGTVNGLTEFFIYEPNCNSHIGGGNEYVPTPSLDGTGTLTNEDHLILQEASSWEEIDPDIHVHGETIKNLGAFVENKTLFELEANQKVRIELYIWLEGQDADCVSKIDEAKITANIQFHVDYSGQSQIVDIPED